MGRECKGKCSMLPNAHQRNRWKEMNRRFCSLCNIAFDPPNDDPYECECCTSMTRGSVRNPG